MISGESMELRAAADAALQDMAADAALCAAASAANPFFNAALLRHALGALREMIAEDAFRAYVQGYSLHVSNPARVGVIMAGNLPFVGFYDLFMVLLSGHRAEVKPSRKDPELPRAFAARLPEAFRKRIRFHDSLAAEDMDLLLATGSDNSALHIRQRYAGLPLLMRANRFSMALLSGREDAAQLRELARDILLYGGLGCRSVSQVLAPAGYDWRRLAAALEAFPEEWISPGYAEAFRYAAAEAALYGEREFPCDRMLLQRADRPGNVPPAQLRLLEYDSPAEAEVMVREVRHKLQTLVGVETGFGKSQYPGIADAPDGADVLQWLCSPNAAG